MEYLEQFAALDAGAQATIMLAVAGGLVWLARRIGLATQPGVVSVIAAVLTGAAIGGATGGWSGALLGAIAGFGATGLHQLGRQTEKARNGGG